MNKNLKTIGSSPLCKGIGTEDLPAVLKCLQAQTGKYEKNTVLIHSGSHTEKFGMVLEGSVLIQTTDYQGNQVILAHVMPGELFGEAFVCGGVPSQVDVVVREDAEILWLDYGRLLSPCGKSCQCHRMITGNLIRILARKNVFLTERIGHLSRRTLREKVMSYLSEQAERCGSRVFEIPFNRQQFADYLAADRSALSAVLCKLRDEGVLEFNKNKFTLRER